MSVHIIERIKKLLRLAADQRGNSHEAERAMAMAFALAEKNRIELSGLDLDEESQRLVSEHWHIGMRFDRLRRGVVGLLQSYFHVSVVLEQPRMRVVGKPTDVAIAQYVHDFLLRAGRDCLKAFEAGEKKARRRLTTNKRAAYIAGFIWGLSSKLRGAKVDLALTDSQNALILAEDSARKLRMQELVPETKTVKALPDRKHLGAEMAGYYAGRATEINQPLGAPTGPLRLN